MKQIRERQAAEGTGRKAVAPGAPLTTAELIARKAAGILDKGEDDKSLTPEKAGELTAALKVPEGAAEPKMRFGHGAGVILGHTGQPKQNAINSLKGIRSWASNARGLAKTSEEKQHLRHAINQTKTIQDMRKHLTRLRHWNVLTQQYYGLNKKDAKIVADQIQQFLTEHTD